jgi:NodT family efflux transporter outer membrane factor (OMF) lipoprotein
MTTGCMLVGTNYEPPDMVVPDAWHSNLSKDIHSGRSSVETWWEKFDDPTLNRLIDRAREANPDLKAALERVTEAQAAREVSRSYLFPSVDANGTFQRTRNSDNAVAPRAPANNPFNTYSTGFNAGWELDFFGGVRRLVESSNASAEAVEEAWRDATVVLLSEVALNYIDYRTLEERIRVAKENIKGQRESLRLTKDRLDAGLASELDVSQVETNVRTSETLIPLLQTQLILAKNRLSTLVGGYPGSIDKWLAKGRGIPVPRRSAGIGIPADLIRSRPDIRLAERHLAAQTAQIGVAEADLYPRFTLSGNFNLDAGNSGDLLHRDARAYGFGPSFRWNIFSAGRIKNNIAIEQSRTRQAYNAYESTVLKAVEDVESSLATIAGARNRSASLNQASTAARKTVSLVNDKFREGLVDSLNVIDAERTLFNTEDEATVVRGQISAGFVALYRSLGGGTPMKLKAEPTKDKK